jgi:HEAT repeat protein
MFLIIGTSVGCSMGQKKAEQKAPEPQKKNLQQLLGDLNSDSGTTRDAALKGIREMGKDAVPTLMKMLDDPTPATRRNAVIALGEIGPPIADATLEKLREMAEKDPDESVRKAAANAVKQIETRF